MGLFSGLKVRECCASTTAVQVVLCLLLVGGSRCVCLLSLQQGNSGGSSDCAITVDIENLHSCTWRTFRDKVFFVYLMLVSDPRV